MRNLFSILVAAVVISGVVFAQGVGGGNKETIAEKLRKDATAGPGYIQSDFVDSLSNGLTEQFGENRSGKMMETMRGQELSSDDMLKLMNGQTTKSGLTDMFGAKRSEMNGLQKTIGKTVDDKNKKMFFGVMIIVMIGDFDMDPDADFCKQCCGARDEMSDDAFKRLMNKNVSTNTIEDAFGLESKDDCKFMQEILNAMMSSLFMQHPMAGSMGMGRGTPLTKGEMEKMPQLGEGMPGFPAPGSGFEEGMAGGMPFDMEMPPCPFAGGNMDEFFGGGEEAPAKKSK